jgi:hypothetical protein
VHDMFARTYLGIPIASAQHANVIADIRDGLFGSFASVMRQVILIMSEVGETARPGRDHTAVRSMLTSGTCLTRTSSKGRLLNFSMRTSGRKVNGSHSRSSRD